MVGVRFVSFFITIYLHIQYLLALVVILLEVECCLCHVFCLMKYLLSVC
jgi:hypothetical protein